jgi:hypothetical protein
MASAETMGVSFALGATLACIVLFLNWLSTTYSISSNSLYWFILPAIGYGIGMGLNSILQLTKCNRINIVQLATGSVFIPLAILIFLGLSTFSFVRKPIEDALPLSYRASQGVVMATAFYIFWAGMFGEAVSSGFAQSCGSS